MSQQLSQWLPNRVPEVLAADTERHWYVHGGR